MMPQHNTSSTAISAPGHFGQLGHKSAAAPVTETAPEEVGLWLGDRVQEVFNLTAFEIFGIHPPVRSLFVVNAAPLPSQACSGEFLNSWTLRCKA